MTARALVAIPSAAQPTVRQALGRCEAEFAATYPDAALQLTRRHYSLIFVGLHFGESAHNSPDAGDEFPDAEWFGHVIVRPHLKT